MKRHEIKNSSGEAFLNVLSAWLISFVVVSNHTLWNSWQSCESHTRIDQIREDLFKCCLRTVKLHWHKMLHPFFCIYRPKACRGWSVLPRFWQEIRKHITDWQKQRTSQSSKEKKNSKLCRKQARTSTIYWVPFVGTERNDQNWKDRDANLSLSWPHVLIIGVMKRRLNKGNISAGKRKQQDQDMKYGIRVIFFYYLKWFKFRLHKVTQCKDQVRVWRTYVKKMTSEWVM